MRIEDLWRECEETLPPECVDGTSDDVIVTDCQAVWIGWYNFRTNQWYTGCITKQGVEPVAWMPLPEPYKE